MPSPSATPRQSARLLIEGVPRRARRPFVLVIIGTAVRVEQRELAERFIGDGLDDHQATALTVSVCQSAMECSQAHGARRPVACPAEVSRPGHPRGERIGPRASAPTHEVPARGCYCFAQRLTSPSVAPATRAVRSFHGCAVHQTVARHVHCSTRGNMGLLSKAVTTIAVAIRLLRRRVTIS